MRTQAQLPARRAQDTCRLFALRALSVVGAMAVGVWQTQAAPTQSSPIAISASNVLVGVNPDANSVSIFDASPATPVKLAEVAVGRDPSSVAITPNGQRAFVANAADGTVSILDLTTRQQTESFPV